MDIIGHDKITKNSLFGDVNFPDFVGSLGKPKVWVGIAMLAFIFIIMLFLVFEIKS